MGLLEIGKAIRVPPYNSSTVRGHKDRSERLIRRAKYVATRVDELICGDSFTFKESELLGKVYEEKQVEEALFSPEKKDVSKEFIRFFNRLGDALNKQPNLKEQRKTALEWFERAAKKLPK